MDTVVQTERETDIFIREPKSSGAISPEIAANTTVWQKATNELASPRVLGRMLIDMIVMPGRAMDMPKTQIVTGKNI